MSETGIHGSGRKRRIKNGENNSCRESLSAGLGLGREGVGGAGRHDRLRGFDPQEEYIFFFGNTAEQRKVYISFMCCP